MAESLRNRQRRSDPALSFVPVLGLLFCYIILHRIPLYSPHLANMFNLAPARRPRPQVPHYSPIEQLHHHPEQAPSECGVPAAFGGVVTDEGVLRLHFHEL